MPRAGSCSLTRSHDVPQEHHPGWRAAYRHSPRLAAPLLPTPRPLKLLRSLDDPAVAETHSVSCWMMQKDYKCLIDNI